MGHPEYVTRLGSSVDLVVDAEVEDEILHFLVIEVKRKTRSGLEPFSDEAKQQAMRYAEILQAHIMLLPMVLVYYYSKIQIRKLESIE